LERRGRQRETGESGSGTLNFEEWLQQQQFDAKALTPAQLEACRAAYEAGRTMPATEEADKLRLCDWATQYYIAGRLAARSRLAPIHGNLLHHAVEMYLKAALVGVVTPKEMRDEYGHDLEKLWARFKMKVADPALDRFDATIHALHEFEDLRYPDKIKHGVIVMAITWKPSDAVLSRAGSTHEYEFFISEVDGLVVEVLDRLSLNLRIILAGRNVRAVQYQNPHAARWGLTRENKTP
jgi:hypothetical protein